MTTKPLTRQHLDEDPHARPSHQVVIVLQASPIALEAVHIFMRVRVRIQVDGDTALGAGAQVGQLGPPACDIIVTENAAVLDVVAAVVHALGELVAGRGNGGFVTVPVICIVIWEGRGGGRGERGYSEIMEITNKCTGPPP